MSGTSTESTMTRLLSLLEEDPTFQDRLIENCDRALHAGGVSLARDQAAAFLGSVSERYPRPTIGVTIRNSYINAC
jgi:hypothetical protein